MRTYTFRAMLVGLFGLMMFNYGFQMVRIPPSGIGVPYIEVLLLCCLPFLFNRTIAKRILRSPWFAPFLVWQLWGGVRILVDTNRWGFVAIRDGLPVLESVFFFVGFALCCRRWVVQAIIEFLPKFCWLVLIYACCMPFSELLLPLSPTLLNMQQQPVPIFFKFINTGSLLVCAAAFLWIRGLHQNNDRPVVPGLFIAAALILFPSRTLILQIATTVLLFLLMAPRSKRPRRLSLFVTVFIAISLVLLITSSDAQVSGRLGKLSPGDYTRLIREMDWRQSVSAAESLTSGTSMRIYWWTRIFNDVTSTWTTTFFGLGYGQPLINFIGMGGSVVREPHNTIVSVFGRLGLSGLIIYLWLTFSVLKLCVNQIRARMMTAHLGPIVGFISAFVVTSLVAGIGESPFILPFITVPYFFGLGMLACMDLQVSDQLNGRSKEQASDPVLA